MKETYEDKKEGYEIKITGTMLAKQFSSATYRARSDRRCYDTRGGTLGGKKVLVASAVCHGTLLPDTVFLVQATTARKPPLFYPL